MYLSIIMKLVFFMMKSPLINTKILKRSKKRNFKKNLYLLSLVNFIKLNVFYFIILCNFSIFKLSPLDASTHKTQKIPHKMTHTHNDKNTHNDKQ